MVASRSSASGRSLPCCLFRPLLRVSARVIWRTRSARKLKQMQESSSRIVEARASSPVLLGSTQTKGTMRSEEHTSELQSHSDLVCRLLLEKKKERHEHEAWHAQPPKADRQYDERQSKGESCRH